LIGNELEQSTWGWIANFIWGIADDVLRDAYVRGKYRDVILPMTVIRRLDAVLESTKQAVLTIKENLDKAGIVNKEVVLQHGYCRTKFKDPLQKMSMALELLFYQRFLQCFLLHWQLLRHLVIMSILIFRRKRNIYRVD